MDTLQIVELIKKMSLEDKLYVIELIFNDIRKEALAREKEDAKRRRIAEMLLTDYETDEELTQFTTLDKEDFYETK